MELTSFINVAYRFDISRIILHATTLIRNEILEMDERVYFIACQENYKFTRVVPSLLETNFETSTTI